MNDATNSLEQTVLNTSPHDVHDLQGQILQDDLAEGTADAPESTAQGEVLELISPEVWAQQWDLLHDMAGGIVQARTNAPCPLGPQARSEGGMIACQAAYDLISISPAAGMILGTHSGFFGQLLAIGVHGFACVQAVKASAAEGQRLEFASRRQEAA